jgi:hypothetical protein
LTFSDGYFAWKRFLWGAWHWLGSFLALSIILSLCVTLVVAVGIGLVVVVQVAQITALTTPIMVLSGLVCVILAIVFEYATVIGVAGRTLNIFQMLGRAVAFMVRQPVRTVSLYVLAAVLGLILIPLYSGVIAPVIAFEWGLVGIAAQQLFIVARLWTRLARQAGEIALYRQGVEG